MIEKICIYLTNKIRSKTPDMDDEKAEVINFGLQLIVGEIPKIFLLILIAFLLGVGPLTLLAFVLILPYKSVSGGFHLKTHVGCVVGTVAFYCGNAFVSQYIQLEPWFLKYILIGLVWIFGMFMCKKYAPADTDNIPILETSERNRKRKLSYIYLTLSLLVAAIVPSSTISNIIIIGIFLQTVSITKIAYKLTKNKYGYEVYGMQTQNG